MATFNQGFVKVKDDKGIIFGNEDNASIVYDSATDMLQITTTTGVDFRSAGRTYGIDHGDLDGLSGDDHAQYLLASDATNRTQFAANWSELVGGLDTNVHHHNSTYYTETEIDAFHVAGVNPADHGNEKHTVEFALKSTVDAILTGTVSGTGQSGQYSIPSGVSTFTITFDTPYNNTDYDVVGMLVNETDAAPAKYGYTMTASTISGFTMELTDITDSANYKFNWRAGDFQSYLDYATQAELVSASGILQTQINNKADTGHTHTESNITDLDKYTQAEVDALVASASGTTDHSALDNLDYASSGHTGFAQSAHTHTEANIVDLDKYTVSEVDNEISTAITTLSGSLQTQIDDKSDSSHNHDATYSQLGHTHDDRYYTESEVDTISGSLQTQIDGISMDHGDLTGLSDDDHPQYLTRTDFTTYSGTLQDQITTNTSGIAANTTTISGNYTTLDNKIDTTSGTLQSSIDDISVDISGKGLTGQYTIASGVNQFTISFPTNFNDTDYDIVTELVNTVDSDPEIYSTIVTETTVSGFKIRMSDYTNCGNFKLNWRAGDLLFAGNASTVDVLDYGSVLTANQSYKGEVLTVSVSGSNFGTVLYQDSDFVYKPADADSVDFAPVMCMALSSGTGNQDVLVRGQVCNTNWNWNAGKIYLSTDVGELTQTKPSGSGDVVIICGWALSADTIFFAPNIMTIEVP